MIIDILMVGLGVIGVLDGISRIIDAGWRIIFLEIFCLFPGSALLGFLEVVASIALVMKGLHRIPSVTEGILTLAPSHFAAA